MSELIERSLEAFSGRDKQLLVVLFDTIRYYKLSIEEVVEHLRKLPEVVTVKETIKSPEKVLELIEKVGVVKVHKALKLLCPKCKQPSLFVRNLPKNISGVNVKGYTLNAACLSEKCDYDEFSHLSVKEFLDERIRVHVS